MLPCLSLSISQRTCVSRFSLVTGCGITFSSPWTNQLNILETRNQLEPAGRAFAPASAIPLATRARQKVPPVLPATIHSHGLRAERCPRLQLPLACRCLLCRWGALRG